jgi:hypothetical protein
MDDQTGISGGRRGALITMGRCSDTLEIEAHRGLTESGKPNRHKINRLLKWLEKAGLIVRRQNPDWPDSMMFYLPVAFEAISEWREWRKMKLEMEATMLRATREAAQPGSGNTRPQAAPRNSPRKPRQNRD